MIQDFEIWEAGELPENAYTLVVLLTDGRSEHTRPGTKTILFILVVIFWLPMLLFDKLLEFLATLLLVLISVLGQSAAPPPTPPGAPTAPPASPSSPSPSALTPTRTTWPSTARAPGAPPPSAAPASAPAAPAPVPAPSAPPSTSSRTWTPRRSWRRSAPASAAWS